MDINGGEGIAPRSQRTPDGRLHLPWLDLDDQIWAVAVPKRGPDGTRRDPEDRKGRLRIEAVDLIRAPSPIPNAVAVPEAVLGSSGLDEARERWLLSTSRRTWTVITAQFGSEAHVIARQLVSRGVVELRVPIRNAVMDLGHPRRWQLAPPWDLLAARVRETRNELRAVAAEDARAAAEMVTDLDPGLAEALRSAPEHWALLPVLVAAARDLSKGLRHDGLRAFSQAHFRNSKVREDAPGILRDAGASEESIDALGLRRSPYIGLGGPISVAGFTTSQVPGPVRFRVDRHRPLRVTLQAAATRLLLVENLQAAEAACDLYPEMATV